MLINSKKSTPLLELSDEKLILYKNSSFKEFNLSNINSAYITHLNKIKIFSKNSLYTFSLREVNKNEKDSLEKLMRIINNGKKIYYTPDEPHNYPILTTLPIYIASFFGIMNSIIKGSPLWFLWIIIVILATIKTIGDINFNLLIIDGDNVSYRKKYTSSLIPLKFNKTNSNIYENDIIYPLNIHNIIQNILKN